MQIVELKVNVEKSQLEALAAEVNKLNGKVINFKTSTTGAGAATAGMQKGFNQTAAAADKAGQSILGVVGKVAKWTAVTTAVYAPIKAFKEAVSTIKALDTEMVNVQKVTGASARQMQQFQDRAYQLSTQYGRSVTDVAAAMTSFARAGYGDKLDEMAELSTLVQNVGYVSEDTADRMLLAVDAAWKLGGSQTELMKVIDGVDKVTNQNATDFQKMAEGMTVAASVFAESGESIQTFAAMVGTGTAATQRGGSEIARGLRTIMMNIRQIKGETEDGELIDGESIAKASAALKEFAGISTMENGELRKASDVLADLAHKWDELDTVQQSAISEALAGKRQANILTALMGNWDMVEKQMKEYADAAGTAFKENDIYMDSWAAKTEQLKAKWTDFVSNFVTSDLATGFLDGLIKGVEVLDSGFGQAAISASALGLALSGIMKVFAAIKGAQIFKDIALFATAFSEVFASQGLLAALGQTAALLGPIGIAIAGIAAVIAGVKLYDFFHVDYDEQIDKVKSLKDEYEELYGVQGEYQALLDKQRSDGGLSAYEQSRLDYLEQYKKSLEDTMELEKQAALERYKQEYGSESGYEFKNKSHEADAGNLGTPKDVETLKEAQKAFDELTESVKNGSKSREQAKSEMEGLLDTYKDFYEEIQAGIDLGAFELEDLDPATQQMMQLYDTMKSLVDLPVEEWGIGSAIMQFDQLAEVGDKSVYNLQAFKQALADAGASAEDIEGTIAQLQSDDNVILIDVEAENIDSTIDSLKELGIATEEAGKTKVNVDEFAKLANQLGLSKEQATGLAQKMKDAGASLVDAEGNAANLESAFANVGTPIQNLTDNIENLVNTIREINGLPPLELKADASQAEGAIDSVEGKKDTFEQPATSSLNVKDNAAGPIQNDIAQARLFGDMRPRPTISVNDRATGVLSGIVGLISSIRDKSVTIMTKFVQQGSPNGYAPTSILRSAVGSVSFRGGPTLLGDELSPDGSPRPELVITKNGAFIAGMSGPVMTSLPAGSRIFKYSDTLDVLSGGDLTQLQAFSAGNSRALDAWKNRSSTPASSSGSSASKPSASSSSSGSSRSSSSRSSGSSRSNGRSGGRSGGSSGSSGGGGSSSVDTLKEELELLEAQYSFLEASNASTEELHNKSKEIQAKLHQINDTLRSTGGKEKDIVDNSTKWWQETEKQRQLLEEDVSLLEAQYEFMEESGASAEDLNAKSAEIQAKLHEINELARATGASEEDILKTSQKWWAELKKIHEVQRDVYQNERNLLQSEADLMEHQNKSASERISKLRQIQSSLHQEAEYMRSIKASQAEINQLSIQWWEIESNIRAIQQDLVDQLNSAMSSAIDRASDRKDDAISELNDQIKELERERKARIESELGEKKAWIEVEEAAIKAIRREQEIAKENQAIADAEADIQEKKVKLLEAEKNLRNAMRQRTVRYYNAKTGQWEWGADARNVKQAQEEYDRAKKDAEDAEANLPKLIEDTELSRRERILNETKDSVQDIEDKINDEFDALIDAVEDEIDALNTGFDDLESEWDDLYQKIFGVSTENIEKILQQMLEQGMITPEQAAEIRAFWEKINGFAASIDDTTKKILAVVKTFAEAKLENPNLTLAQYLEGLEEEGVVIDTSKFSPSLVDFITNNPNSGWQAIGENGVGIDSEGNIFVAASDVHARRAGTYYSEDENGNGVYVSSGDVARSHFHTGDDGTQEQLEERRRQRSQGQAGKTRSSSSTSSESNVISQMQSNSAAWHNASASEKQRLADENKKLGESQGWSRGDDGAWYDKNGKRVYDSGGILNGFGGIKATTRDEIVIPPDLAEYMLKPSANKTFQSRVSELAYLYGAKPIPGALSNNRSSNDHYGDTYTFGNVTLTEDKARTTTVYELAQMSRSLGIYRNG